MQSGEKRNEQSGLQIRTAHPIKTTQTANSFSAGLSMDILVRITGLEPMNHKFRIITVFALKFHIL